MKILVTGGAGFIGYHLINKLISNGCNVVGLDSINEYYSVDLKYDRLQNAGIKKELIYYNTIVQSTSFAKYSFIQLKLEDNNELAELFATQQFDIVVNLAAQAGVRYSITNPSAYINSNIVGFANLIENCRKFSIKHFVYASSSSVYGLNEVIPFSTKQTVDHPISLYAATKKSNELIAHVYSHLHNLPTTGLRFFTVYGPWGRPDMAMFLFTKAIIDGSPIEVFNNGEMERDFTYVDDVVNGVLSVINNTPDGNLDWSGLKPDPSSSKAPYKLYNIGNSAPVKLMDFITAIENKLEKKAEKKMMPMQPGDVHKTYADVNELKTKLGYSPATTLQTGVNNFIDWYTSYFK